VRVDRIAMRRWSWDQIRRKLYRIDAEVGVNDGDSGTGAGLGRGNGDREISSRGGVRRE